MPPRRNSAQLLVVTTCGWLWLLACSADGSGRSGPDGTAAKPAGSGASTAQVAGSAGAASSAGATSSAGAPSTSGGSSSWVAGAGGAPTGGAGNQAGVAGSSGGAAPVSGCAQADILCLTFDDLATGSLPQAPPFRKYDCAGQATSTDLLVEAGQGVNGSHAFTSKKSLNGGCNLLADLGEHAELWVTADVKFSSGVPVGSVHELTPFEITKTASDDPGIRPGIRADSSCNSWQGAELNITGGAERTGCTAVQLDTERWYCLEAQVKNLPASVEGHLFIDGVEPGYHIHQDATTSVVNPDWTGARLLRLGTRSYSASVDSPIYVDNLSVSTQRVGCSHQ